MPPRLRFQDRGRQGFALSRAFHYLCRPAVKSFSISLRFCVLAALVTLLNGSAAEGSDSSDGLTRTVSDLHTTTATDDFTPSPTRIVLTGTLTGGALELAPLGVTLLETRTLTERK